MDAVELLRTRASNGRLVEPAPDAETLGLAMEAAARAPDHAALRPWRVWLIRSAARAKFGDVLADAEARAHPGASAEQLEKARSKAFRAPLVIVVGAVIAASPVVPEVEQLLAAGAAAHAILLTLHARGYAAIWRTGGPAYDAEVKRAFGLSPSDALLGFIYAGTAQAPVAPQRRAAPASFAHEWPGD